MHISGEGKIGIALTLALGVGAGAAMMWPTQAWIGLGTIVFSSFGLAVLAYVHFCEPDGEAAKAKAAKDESHARQYLSDWSYLHLRVAVKQIDEKSGISGVMYKDRLDTPGDTRFLDAWNLVRALISSGSIKVYGFDAYNYESTNISKEDFERCDLEWTPTGQANLVWKGERKYSSLKISKDDIPFAADRLRAASPFIKRQS